MLLLCQSTNGLLKKNTKKTEKNSKNIESQKKKPSSRRISSVLGTWPENKWPKRTTASDGGVSCETGIKN